MSEIKYQPVTALKPKDYESAAKLLGCEVAAVRSVSDVESSGEGFINWRGNIVPRILFEKHVFHRLTGGKFDKVAPDLSSPTPGGYGTYTIQHDKLSRACELDRDAALQSASWGLFQILGTNHKQAGYNDLQTFVNAMFNGVGDHLQAFCNFIKNDSRLLNAIRNKDWANFARIYNGPAYKKNQYDNKLAAAYKRYS